MFETGKFSVPAANHTQTIRDKPNRKQSAFCQVKSVEEKERKQLDIGTRVAAIIKGDNKHGIIRWIGDMNHRLMAGVEMVQPL